MKGYALIAVVLVAVGAVMWWQDAPVLVLDPQTQLTPTASSHYARTQSSVHANADLQQLDTFKGAQVDGYLRTDHRGQLVIDINLRRWIDFHLSAQGELTLDEIVAYMQQQMQLLPQPGSGQALTILTSYLAYLSDLAEYESEAAKRMVEPSFDELEQRLAWQQRLRREHLDPQVVRAFFHDDEVIDQHTLMTRRLMREGASTDQLAALEQELPEEIQQARKESRLLISHAHNEEALRAQGASARDIHNWRVQEYGVEAADRLAKLDTEQAAWQTKLTAYQQYEISVANLDDAERDKLLQTYLNKHFSDNEQKRLPAALSLLAQ